MTRRVWFAVLLGVALVAAVVAEVWAWRGGLLRLPIPLAVGRGFPLPLVTWGSVALYTAWYGTAFRLSRDERWARAVRLGFGVHALMLLSSEAWAMVHDRPADFSVWYLRYWYLVWGAVLALGLAGAWRWLARWRAARRPDPFLYYLPLPMGVAVCWMAGLILSPRIAFGAAVAGVGLLAGSRLRVARSWAHDVVEWLRDERVSLALVALVALALRLFYTARVMSNPDFLNTGSDGPPYDAMAWAIAHGQPVESTHWGHMTLFAPGYVRFLALLYTLFGRNYFLVCAVQSLLGAGACVLLAAVATRLFDVATARIAAAFAALNFQLIFAAAAIGHQALDLFWTLLVVWSLVRYVEDPARWGRRLFGIGLLLGWAAATREGNIAFWGLLIGWFLLGVRAKLGWRTALVHVAALSLGFLLMLSPFLIHAPQGSLMSRVAYHWFFYQTSSVHLNEWFNPWRTPAAAWALFHAQPLTVIVKVIEGVIGNFNVVFLNQGFGGFDLVFLLRGSTYYFGMWWYAYVLAFSGLWLVLREAWRQPVTRLGWWLLLTVLVSRALPHLFLEAGYRHRVPMEPYLILLAAYALTRLLHIGRPARWPSNPA